MHAPHPLNIALAGLGTVGAGVVRLLEANRDLIARRAGRPIRVVAVSARDRTRDRGVDLSRYRWSDSMTGLAQVPDVDVVVELVGGADGPALDLARDCLSRGKSLVTANKAMVAYHGQELGELAERHRCGFRFEGAVAGGIPVIKGLREGAAANELVRVYGILNGTANYIISHMEDADEDFATALGEAQQAGYAETDPSFDIDGVDAAHKLAILSSLAFGTKLDFGGVDHSGIRALLPQDLQEARSMGFAVRLIGAAEMTPGGVRRRVAPMLVPRDHPLASVDGATNAVVAEGDYVGRLLFQGAGAGEGPTASAVVADLIALARGETGPAFAVPARDLADCVSADPGARHERNYVRFGVADHKGVLAEITAAMRDADVSIDRIAQRGQTPEGGNYIAVVTHEAPARCTADMVRRLTALDSVVSAPQVFPLLEN